MRVKDKKVKENAFHPMDSICMGSCDSWLFSKYGGVNQYNYNLVKTLVQINNLRKDLINETLDIRMAERFGKIMNELDQYKNVS